MAVVYSREIDGNILNLAPSGWTYGDNIGRSVFVLIDKETESLWFPIDQQCCVLPTEEIGSDSGLIGIGGAYADRVLEDIQVLSITTWAEWKKAFPDTKFVRE